MITKRSLFKAVNDRKGYITKDRKYMTEAITVTTKRLGPSGSLIASNIALEHVRAVTARIVSEIVFDLKYMG